MVLMHRWASIAALLMALGVALGAFGAHGLRERLSEYGAAIYEKAVLYHFVHAIGLFLVCLLAAKGFLSPVAGKRIAFLLVIGIVLFSGSLYLLAVTRISRLGIVTPFGGTAFIVAWLLLAYELFQKDGI